MSLDEPNTILIETIREATDANALARRISQITPKDRQLTLDLLRAHGIAGRAHQLLAESANDAIPQDWRHELERVYRRQTVEAILVLQKYGECSKALSQNGVEHVALKGVRLLDTLYRRTPGVRPVTDIDLLVKHRDIARAEQALDTIGGTPPSDVDRELNERYQHHHHYYFEVGGARLRVELHWRHSIEFGQCIDSRRLWRWIGDADAPVSPLERQLKPTAELYLLLIHLASNGFRVALKWVRDIVRFLEVIAVDTNGLLQLARDEGTTGACFYALALARYLGDSTQAGQLLSDLRPLLPRHRMVLLDRLARPSWVFSRQARRTHQLPASVMACLLPDELRDQTIATARAITFRLHRQALRESHLKRSSSHCLD